MNIDKSYYPHDLEQTIYARWESGNFFKPTGQGVPYCMMLPPPNVTGSLHMGHGFQVSLMDALIRYHRMMGLNTFWQGGVDHAGIATQLVVEKQLGLEGQSRHAMGREKFIDRVWRWKKESGDTIHKQFCRMGASIDWNSARFTLDENFSKAVRTAFVRLYQENLIYRGKRLTNWDPTLHTAVSDLEVINEERAGYLWYIRYPIVDSLESLVIATTRPETLLGDTAVAVNPDDERYQSWIGKKVKLPLVGREIPIIADHDVDPTFGTGCVKITPAHDFNDYEMGKRHQLPLINIFTSSAHLNDQVPEKYRGMARFAAREIIVNDLQSIELLVKVENYRVKIPIGDRSGDVLEPWLTDQWFMKMEPLAKPAVEAVHSGKLKFIPANWNNTFFQWMTHLQDWCISRQLWWGHRIPAWYDSSGKVYVGMDEESIRTDFQLNSEVKLMQDEDVLDTWFSSALWPFATLGWPETTEALKTFYPTSVLVTGFDIIFFWVARMTMLGLKFMGDVPFHEVYITGLIRDKEGQKMSKSKGNVLDPIDLIDGISLETLLEKRTVGLMQPSQKNKIEQATKKQFPEGIAAHGTDALRLTFCSLASTGRDIRFDLNRLEGYRNFCNKLWNAARFSLMNLSRESMGKECITLREIDRTSWHIVNRWILSSFNRAVQQAHEHFKTYRFDLLTQVLYEFTWHEFCDWYLELVKTLRSHSGLAPSHQRETQQTLIYVLEALLRLLHPLAPFITEALWQQMAPLAGHPGKTIMQEPYPLAEDCFMDEVAEKEVSWLKNVVLTLRNVRSEMIIPPSKKIPLFVRFNTLEDQDYFSKYHSFIQNLAKLESITIWAENNNIPPRSLSAVCGKLELFLPVAEWVDIHAEISRLKKEKNRLEKDIEQFSQKLKNENFLKHAPLAIVEKEQLRLREAQASLQTLLKQLEKMQMIK